MFVILSSEGPSGLHGNDLRVGLLGDNHMCDRLQIPVVISCLNMRVSFSEQ